MIKKIKMTYRWLTKILLVLIILGVSKRIFFFLSSRVDMPSLMINIVLLCSLLLILMKRKIGLYVFYSMLVIDFIYKSFISTYWTQSITFNIIEMILLAMYVSGSLALSKNRYSRAKLHSCERIR